jgi:hypothetical protein
MLKILAITCICLCAVVIAYVVKIYFEFPKLPKEKKEEKFRF